jgi:hypothetical protein
MKQSTIRKGATGSAALAASTVLGDLLGVALSLITGGIIVPWLVVVIPWLAAHALNHLHHDLLLFLLLILLLFLLVISGFSYLTDSEKPASKRLKKFGEFMGVSTLLLGSVWLFCEWVFQIQITLGFISTTHVGPFPNFASYAAHPDRTVAFVWLVYYVAVHGFCALLGSPPSARETQIPLSHPAPDGPRELHIRQCYQHLANALMAWDPPPVEYIKWPEFAYYEGKGPLLWQGHTLVISEALMDPAQTAVLLPALAREIAHCNGPDKWLTSLMTSYPRRTGGLVFLAITGNWIWLPALISGNWWHHWQHERVLDIDAFVHAAGQSAWLLHDLRRQRYEIQKAGAVDTSWPTLLERIDHLEMLIGKEATQMKNQNIKPAPTQIAGLASPTPRQLKRGTGTENKAH